jgi:outer membrane protein OmpU
VAIANLGNLEMKKVLLGTTALLGVGLMAGTAAASDGIKLSLGGFYRTAYMVNFDDDNEGELGNDRNTDGLFTDGEVFFNGSLTMDNGLTVGVRIELEAEQEGDQIDESFAYFQGNFGTVRIGNDDSAMQGACITPPGLTTNFGAFSPGQWASNDSVAIQSGGTINAPTSNSVCFGVDNDATKMVYYSPNWSGFSFALSYTPDGAAEGAGNSGGHNGMGARADGSSQHNVSGYVSYGYEGEGWGLNIGGGADFVGRVDGDGDEDTDEKAADHYQTGVVLNFGGLSVGGAFQYYNDFSGTSDDGWVAGGGVSYNVDAWTVGLQYSHLDFDNEVADDDFDTTRDRIVLTGEYAMGPGVSLDASLGYTWVDVSGADDGSDADNADNYDAFEIGIGTAFTF